MGLSTSATHIIFFIASVVIAASFVGIAASAVLNISNGIENRGDMIANQLSGEFKIINDPTRMSNNPLVLYLKNTGKVPLSTSHITVLIDGTAQDNYTVSQDTWLPGETIVLTINVDLVPGTHVVKVVLENGLSDTFYFRV
ncbi:putative archaeal flagellar protein G [Aciduliprofundum sp. MAR08-339]|uniref:flagellar protein G n=1 Tax=Aciduliprofundum sp. (strain MAR08-339) TaxID=673860 RepID=UPI0002A47EEB|nr:putative archaeal flagellar protein G [Aciduliprofundum sp. MAR08-339]